VFGQCGSPAESTFVGGTPALLVTSEVSPLAWLIVLCILLSLAVSSMAQPRRKICGVKSRYRTYLSSSPIICVADAISTIIRFIAIKYFLSLDAKTASQLVIKTNSDEFEIQREVESNVNDAFYNQARMRWIFFALTSIAAGLAMKYGLLDGSLWTKSLAMMFAASFILTESIVRLDFTQSPLRPASYSPPMLEKLELQESQLVSFHAKVSKIARNIDKVEAILFIAAVFTHFCLLAWAINSLWVPRYGLLLESNVTKSIVLVVDIVMAGLSVLSVVLWLVLWSFGRLPERKIMIRYMWWGFEAIQGSRFFVPRGSSCKQHKSSVKEPQIRSPPISLCKLSNMTMVWVYIGLIVLLCHWIMILIHKRWPAVAKTLLIEWKPKQSSKGGKYNSDQDVHAEGKKSFDEIAWITLCFFVINFVVCVLWYALMYDPRAQ
jgi:hypothetical protein